MGRAGRGGAGHLPLSRLWEELDRSRAGVYWQETRTDGLLRAYAYRVLEGYPLLVAVGAAMIDIEDGVAGLRRTLLNLLSNAVTFTPEGGRILVRAAGARGACRIEVVDNGIGMTPEQLSQAVVPFGQPTAMVARPGQGSGLGLSIVKSLMEAHGGRLRIDSRPGEGSRFTLEFGARALC